MEKSEMMVRSAIEDLKRHECCIILKTDTWVNKIVIYMTYQGAIITGEIENIDLLSLEAINMKIYERLYVMFARISSEVNNAQESIHRA